MKVLSLCDKSGIMVQPWLESGYECIIVDVQHSPGEHKEGRLTRIGADVLTWELPPGPYAVAFAFPPCTDLAVSGARWFKDKGILRLIYALQVVERCRQILQATGAPSMIENPVSVLSSHWRKPDFKFDPSDYAGYLESPIIEAYTKATCLWTDSGFRMPKPRPVFPELGSKMHLLPPSLDRADLRSVTPGGFAKAVYDVNRKS